VAAGAHGMVPQTDIGFRKTHNRSMQQAHKAKNHS
jgi:hypothetical protein